MGTGEGLKEYRLQRENGVPQDIAFNRALVKGVLAVGAEKLDDYIGKNNPIGDVLRWKEVPIDKIEEYAKIKPIWLDKKEYGHVMHELMTNITEEEKVRDFIWRPIGDYIYYFRKNAEGYYDIVDRVEIFQEEK